jgi:hypothetical protein
MSAPEAAVEDAYQALVAETDRCTSPSQTGLLKRTPPRQSTPTWRRNSSISVSE